ncbi:MAG: hypothetical protein F6J87_07865 [Spirulina sp. SIO3F2]|nr:hypothetical protein [Spirulina sp. SIO3F2]
MTVQFKATSMAVGLGLISAIAAASSAEAFTFNFDNGNWTHGNQTSVGWLDGATSGSTTVGGITLSVNSTVFGGAQANENNLRDTTSQGTIGFRLGNEQDTAIYRGGNLSAYQRLDFEFSTAVNLGDFIIGDIDTNDLATGFVDAVAVEGFNGSAGAIGTGLGAVYSFAQQTTLTTESIATENGEIDFVVRDVEQFGLQNSRSVDTDDAYISFDSPIRSFSIYYFNDALRKNGVESIAGNQAVNLFEGNGVSGFTATEAAPEPFSMIGGGLALALGGLARRRSKKG